MKKTLLSIFLSFVLCFNFPLVAFAEAPTAPDVTGLSNEEAAALVDEYNKQVDNYNQELDKEYEAALQQYKEDVAYNEEATKHNEQEDAKVEETNAANQQEQARVDAINEQLVNNYQQELAEYNSKLPVPEEETAPKYTTVVNDKETLYYDEDNNLLYKSVAGATAKDDIVTYENVGTNEKPKWSNTYNFNGTNKRYVNFSIISTIGKTTTGTDWDNDASKYSNKVYSTIANSNGITSLPLNYTDEGEGRNLINYLTEKNGEVIGLEQCDTLIRNLVTSPIDNYFNAANGSEAAGMTKVLVTLADFPSTATVFKNLQTNGSVFIDPDTNQRITGTDINSDNYTLRWFSVKYQSNGWRVSGVLLKNGVIVPPAEPEYEVANLISYTPQYVALREIVEPVRAAYLEHFIFTPVTQDETIIPQTQNQPIVPQTQSEITIPQNQTRTVIPQIQNDRTIIQTPVAISNTDNTVTPIDGDNTQQYYTADTSEYATGASSTRPVSAVETITDEKTPLASGIIADESSDSWALLNLIFMILNVLLLVIIPRKKKEDEEEKQVQYRTNALGIILALAAILVFIFTQNVYLPMVIVDQWTPLMGVFAAGGIVTKVFSHKKDKN